jgi:hypothetical protein
LFVNTPEPLDRRNAMLRKIIEQVHVPELRLAQVECTPRQNNWLPAFATSSAALDTTCWQTRGARGLSWHRSGKFLVKRIAH